MRQLAAVLIFASGHLAAPASAQQTVKIGSTPSFIFLPVYAAEELGYFKAAGIKAEFVDFEGGAEVTMAMVGGSIEMGATMVERPMILSREGVRSQESRRPRKQEPPLPACPGRGEANDSTSRVW